MFKSKEGEIDATLLDVSNPIRENVQIHHKWVFYLGRDVSNPIRENVQILEELEGLEVESRFKPYKGECSNLILHSSLHRFCHVSNPIRENVQI